MKKLILIFSLVLCTKVFYGQVNYYASVGASYTNTVVSPGAEAGIYTDKFWLSLGYDYLPTEQWASVKLYLKLMEQSKFTIYQYNAFKTWDRRSIYEFGAAAVYDLSENWAPQLTLTTTPKFNYVSYGLGINYWFKRNKK